MSNPNAHDFIDGGFAVPGERLSGTVDDPNTGEVLEPQVATSRTGVEQALAAADRVHAERSWLDFGAAGRAELLVDLAAELALRAQEIADSESINPGIVISLARAIAGGCAEQVLGVTAQLNESGDFSELPGKGRGGPVRLRRDPWGPALVLVPWNAPAPTAVGKSAAALAAGCPVIVKPSEWAPGSSRILAQAIAAVGFPAGVFQLVHGGAAVGSQLAGDARIRAVALTGGQEAGRSIAALAAPHFTRLQLELGGNNPVVVLEDADISLTARALAAGMTKLNGQWCEAPGKVFVPQGMHDDLVEALLGELRQLTIGISTELDTNLGPLAFSEHRERLLLQIATLTNSGGRIRSSHEQLPSRGWFLSPTLVLGVDAAKARNELFGPVLTIHPVSDAAHALRLAQDTPDGLAGYVFGSDIGEAMDVAERLPGGEIKVNGTSLFDLTADSHQSFWGASGHGGHGAGELLEFFRGNRIVGVDNPDAPI